MVFLLGFVVPLSDARAAASYEYQLKAAFLYNFGKFVEWPAGSLDASDRFGLCLIGDSRIRTRLDSIHGRTIHDKKIDIIVVEKIKKIEQCHLLFISASEKKNIKKILLRSQQTNTLTVSDIPDFAKAGGMIQMFTVDRKVRFNIHLGAAKQAGLIISSRLLNLAKNIYRYSEGGDKK